MKKIYYYNIRQVTGDYIRRSEAVVEWGHFIPVKTARMKGVI